MSFVEMSFVQISSFKCHLFKCHLFKCHLLKCHLIKYHLLKYVLFKYLYFFKQWLPKSRLIKCFLPKCHCVWSTACAWKNNLHFCKPNENILQISIENISINQKNLTIIDTILKPKPHMHNKYKYFDSQKNIQRQSLSNCEFVKPIRAMLRSLSRWPCQPGVL